MSGIIFSVAASVLNAAAMGPGSSGGALVACVKVLLSVITPLHRLIVSASSWVVLVSVTMDLVLGVLIRAALDSGLL